MDALNRRIVLVTRKTRLEDLVTRFNTLDQARFYVEHLGADFADYELEQRLYQQAVSVAEATLSRFGRVHRLDRGFLPNYLFAPDALVVVLGQDGLVANTLKYLRDGQPVVGVNPDPARWDGVLLPFRVQDLAHVAPLALSGRHNEKRVTMARAVLNDGQELHAVNDLFIGPRTHVSARYLIEQDQRSEQQSSSGVIVSTGLGSTGWFQSLLAGAAAVAGHGLEQDAEAMRGRGFAWDAGFLQYTVREPFPSRTTQVAMAFGTVTRDTPLSVVSQMPGYGVIFSDGVEADFLEFNAGMTAVISLAEREGRLVV
ncbi:sugar kinase [Pseudoxanthomonas sp. JBR18]|uniref:sugar kinase n=1 Tax=Pseudoxanthomonas sp. JBR18 TaxID=2969308 RepID=UPI00230651B1|nr:sugar kinase [Pseudoxanthomonas sp. JBR18]WCE04872.1 sugar kinase [Pseudoxanthomonas sp. JBR18]